MEIEDHMGLVNLFYQLNPKEPNKNPHMDKVMLYYRPLTQTFYVVKFLSGVQTEKRGDFTRKRFNEERNVLKNINHPAILKLINSGQDKFNGPWLQYEFIPFETVSYYLDAFFMKNNGFIPKFDFTQQMIILYGVARALNVLHSKGVIHRDLKPQNIMLDGNFHPILIDFGLAKYIKSEENTNCGTYNYSPPEILESLSEMASYTNKSDVYSFGITANEIVLGMPPFIIQDEKGRYHPLSRTDVRKKILAGIRPDHDTNHLLSNLIKQCWQQDPRQRPEFIDICDQLEDIFEEYCNSLKIEEQNRARDRFYSYMEILNFAEQNENQYVRAEWGTVVNFMHAANLGIPRSMNRFAFFLRKYSENPENNEMLESSINYIIASHALTNHLDKIENPNFVENFDDYKNFNLTLFHKLNEMAQ